MKLFELVARMLWGMLSVAFLAWFGRNEPASPPEAGDELGLKPLSRWQRAAAFAMILGAVAAGAVGIAWWWVLGLGVALLFIGDYGQHGVLAARHPGLPRWYVLALSTNAYLAHNLLGVGLGYIFGRLWHLVFRQ